MIWSASASADSHNGEAVPSTEVFSGVDATSNSLFGYAGAVWAFGRSISGEGLRVKVLAGTGGYDYDGALPGVAGSVNFDGDVVLAQLLGGYLWRAGGMDREGLCGPWFRGS